MLKRLITSSLGLASALAIVGAGIYWRLQSWSSTPTLLTTETIIEFPSGTPLSRLASKLYDAGVISSREWFLLSVRLRGSDRQFQAGKYRFIGSVTPDQVVTSISKGDIFQPTVLSITVPEGFTQRQVIERLAANGVGHVVELQRLAQDRVWLKSLEISAPSLEGYLYPATYSFTQLPTAQQALAQMVKTFWQNLPRDYQSKIASKGLSLHDAVTFASLIEAETMQDDERSLVSEVIWRRLKDRVPLGIDAALIYGIPDYAGDLKSRHLVDPKNPFNTRIHRGLPPGPIGNPSAKSLVAVLEPSHHGYYYYVLIPGTDRHHFSRTLQEHNEHVRKLIQASRRDQALERNRKQKQ